MSSQALFFHKEECVFIVVSAGTVYGLVSLNLKLFSLEYILDRTTCKEVQWYYLIITSLGYGNLLLVNLKNFQQMFCQWSDSHKTKP